MAEKKEYRIKVQGQLVPVTEEVYVTYHRMKRRETYLEVEKSRTVQSVNTQNCNS